MPKKALITGITGQDGSYLTEFLLQKGHEVHGIVRRVAIEDSAHRMWRIKHLLDDVRLHSADLAEKDETQGVGKIQFLSVLWNLRKLLGRLAGFGRMCVA